DGRKNPVVTEPVAEERADATAVIGPRPRDFEEARPAHDPGRIQRHVERIVAEVFSSVLTRSWVERSLMTYSCRTMAWPKRNAPSENSSGMRHSSCGPAFAA